MNNYIRARKFRRVNQKLQMKNILAIQKPNLIQSDNGTEFMNKSFQGLLKSANFRHITVDVGNHRR